MFRLSAFRERLLEHFQKNPKAIHPPQFHAEIMTALSSPLEDLSISRPRSRITWAITVPEDPEHSIYVWFDALTVYLSATGYPWTTPETETNKAVFPPNLQIIGKDILRYVAACTTDPHKG